MEGEILRDHEGPVSVSCFEIETSSLSHLLNF